MSITATEFKKNLGKYLELLEHEDIFISKNGKVIAKLTNPNKNRLGLANSIIGIIPDSMTLEEAKNKKVEKV